MQGSEPTDKDAQALKKELARLRAKLQHSSDRDIRAALQMRIEQIQAEMPKEPEKPAATIPKQEEPEQEAPVAPATPEQIVLADRLIQQARVEKMRKNVARSTDLLREAAQMAPGSPVVLEALGDDLVERRQLKEAANVYKRAVRLDPKNVGLESKYAELVLQLESLGSLDDQLRRNLSDSPFLTSDETLARVPYAALLSVFIPGAGHMVLGQTAKGIAILVTWVTCLIWIAVQRKDVEGLVKVAGGQGQVHYTVLFPIAVAVAVFVGTLLSFKGMQRTVVPHKPIARPAPPAEGGNLPFE